MKGFKFILINIASILLWSCGENTSKKGVIEDFIPKDASVVFKVSNFETLQKDLSNNAIINNYKKVSAYKFLSEKATLLRHLKPEEASIIAISEQNDSTASYTFITRESPKLFIADSLKNTSIETLAYNDISMQRIIIEDKTAFTTTIDSVFVASSSQKVLQDIIEKKTLKDPVFKKVASIKSNAEVEMILPATALKNTDSSKLNFASWVTLDIAVLPDAITATGVALARDTVPQLINVFKGQIPQKNNLAQITPTDYKWATSITYSNAEALTKSINTFKKDSLNQISSIIGSTNEAGSVVLEKGVVIALKSIDATLTQDALAPFITETSSLREVTIYSFSETDLFSEAFSPLLNHTEANYMIQLDDFFVFTPTEDIANQCIIAFKNKDVLSETSYYQDSKTYIGESSSMLLYRSKEHISDGLSMFFNSKNEQQIKNKSLSKYPLALLQFSYDRDFAHINLVCKEASTSKQVSAAVSQETSITLENEILGNPQFFSNHRTNSKDIVVQDVTNTLHLFAINGRSLWTKKLDKPILGEINEVDILRNGKKQLAFTTASTLYVVDRNGKDVAPFPIKFKDEVTQPLSVFDYDNNRKYRFVITQDKDVLLYNSEGKLVKGFGFNGTKSSIVQPPKHIRMGNKDYIIIAEENGKLTILSRVGKNRVTVTKTFSFSKIPVTREGSNFVVITKDNKKASINQNGKVSFQNLNISPSYWFTTKGSIKATLDDNLLRINGKLVELPFGIYTNPQLFLANRTTYISVTETQENKVYVYDKTGRLLSGFPIYGISESAISSVKNKSLVLTKANDKEIIVYGF
ncbi:hypothetical protein [Patiriisocius hiemis]|uniref:Uncharacterized protein n=1 Tax=Patiriisocius hiemis TaxID=3075604 RepID=A0ABU2YCA1_9FLAO|nr:hypothetical protein [Constantimarinum sp. W242]MDT0555815.1 hypothetical protein [Constantimarinum sp. W242]